MSDEQKHSRAEMDDSILKEADRILTEQCGDLHELKRHGETILDESENLTPGKHAQIEAALKEVQRASNTAWALCAAIIGYRGLFAATLKQATEAGLLDLKEQEE